MSTNGRCTRWFVALVLTALVPIPMARADASHDLDAALRATETAFAATMAARDLEGFAKFIAPEAVFFSGDEALRGRDAIIAAWSAFFDADEAPFSWHPSVVVVLDTGRLGLTSGPVLDAAGEQVGSFNSIWRREDDGSWKIVFDRGCD